MSDFQTNNAQGPAPQAKSVSFGEAVKLFFSNYVNFSGRSTKSEFWWGYLFCVVIVSLLLFLQEVFELSMEIRYGREERKRESAAKKSKKAAAGAKKNGSTASSNKTKSASGTTRKSSSTKSSESTSKPTSSSSKKTNSTTKKASNTTKKTDGAATKSSETPEDNNEANVEEE